MYPVSHLRITDRPIFFHMVIDNRLKNQYVRKKELKYVQRKFSGKLPIYELLGSLTGIVVLAVVVIATVVVVGGGVVVVVVLVYNYILINNKLINNNI